MTTKEGQPITFTCTRAAPNYYIIECSALVAATLQAGLNANVSMLTSLIVAGDLAPELARQFQGIVDRSNTLASALDECIVKGLNASVSTEINEMEGKESNDNGGSSD
jgi:hypothetical protein